MNRRVESIGEMMGTKNPLLNDVSMYDMSNSALHIIRHTYDKDTLARMLHCLIDLQHDQHKSKPIFTSVTERAATAAAVTDYLQQREQLH